MHGVMDVPTPVTLQERLVWIYTRLLFLLHVAIFKLFVKITGREIPTKASSWGFTELLGLWRRRWRRRWRKFFCWSWRCSGH